MAEHILLISEARTATVQLLERILDHLAQTTTLTVTSRLLDELEPSDIAAGTYPVLVRSCHPTAMRLVRAFTRARVAYGFYIDDNFWLLDPQTELGRHYRARPTRRRLDAIVGVAQPVIASTPLLAGWIAPRARAVVQLDSFFDFSLVPAELAPRPQRSGLRAGFAASTHRGGDLAAVMSDVLPVLDDHPDLELEIIGADADAMPGHPRITVFPHVGSYPDYLAFQRQRAWDIGLAPLGAAASNRYKTDNKYREYAALGIAGVYQDSPPYAAVRDGETGLLAGDEQSWGDALRRYCDDPALIDAVRTAARADAEQRVSLDAVEPHWHAFFAIAPSAGAVDGAVDRVRQRLSPPRSALGRRMLRLRLLWAYGTTHLAEHGIAATVGRTLSFFRHQVARPESRS